MPTPTPEITPTPTPSPTPTPAAPVPHPTPKPEEALGLTQEEIDNIYEQFEERKNGDTKFYKYFEAGYLKIQEELAVDMFDKMIRIESDRRISPLNKYDNLHYPHRYLLGDITYNLVIGDSQFVIPPQVISISSEMTGQELVTLRQENTQKIRNGYTKRIINIELVFHGYDQINGYKVESPEGYYYVDGLRQLLAQFKCTPFLPITNYTINNTYGITTVALQSIMCSTVEGFPDMMIANISLQEVDLYPYLEIPTMFFEDIVDWDLFRFYYQRQLTEKHEYGKLQSIPLNKELNNFKISILKEEVFNDNINYNIDMEVWYDASAEIGWEYKGRKTNFSFYDIALDKKIIHYDEEGNYSVSGPTIDNPSNYETYIDSTVDNIHIVNFQSGYSNIITNMQLAEMAHPTIQYMGGMDTIFNITFETTDESIIRKIENCNLNNNKLIRNHKQYASLGFIKLESELVELFGSKFVMVSNVTTHTVPDFPGLFIVQVQCVSFDIYQKEKEGIKGFNPFKDDREGEYEDAIEQTPTGLKNKISQDLNAENKLRASVELYPDLKLPTYQEVDEVIQKIKTFRANYKGLTGETLTPYPLDKYPRNPQHSLHGITKVDNIQVDEGGFVSNVSEIIKNGPKYEGYVDPDFYVFYPDTYKELMKETKEELQEENMDFKPNDPKATNTKVTEFVSSGTANSAYVSDVTSYEDSMYSNGASPLQLELIARAREKIGATYSNRDRLGPDSYDCSGLVSKCLMEMGIITSPFATSTIDGLIKNGTFRVKHEVNTTSKTQELLSVAVPGDLLHVYVNELDDATYGHIAIYIGNNRVIHATGSKGVHESGVANYYRRVIEIPKLSQRSSIKQEVTINKEFTLDFGMKKGDSGDEVLRLQELLNIVNNANLELDGEFGSLTEQAVIDFQTKYSIEEDGYVGHETSKMLTSIANSNYKNSYVNVNIKNNAEKNGITSDELMAVAKTIANIQLTDYNIQLAFAQLIYDMFTDKNSKYGTLTDVLNNKMFKGQYNKTLYTESSVYIAAQDVFCNNKKVSEKKIVKYLGLDSGDANYSDYDNLYERMQTEALGEFTFWVSEEKSSDKKYTLTDSENDLLNPTIQIETEINTGVSEVTEEVVERFGMPVLIKTEEMNGDAGWFLNAINNKADNQEAYYKTNYNTDIQRLSTSFVNQCEYSGKGRLVKAFPSYLFCIVDEDGNWLNGRKLWANYYMLRSLVDIQVASYNDSPISTATITVTNSYGNLDTLPPNAFYYKIENDDEYNDFQKFNYKHFGMLIGLGPKLTDKLLDMKNYIYDSMVIRAGSRMHLRMGYGSDPLGLPVVMNGYISDLSVGDITQFVCVSDGVELTNALVSDNPKDKNNLFDGTDQEPSNMFISVLTSRQSWANKLSRNWGEPSKYGIEHFGLYMSEKIDVPDWSKDMFKDKNGDGIELPGWLVDSMNVIQGVGEAIVTFGRGILDNFVKSWQEVQYDINKNIYRTSYDGSLAMYTPFWGFIDGEENICFNKYNKTPWDVMQMGVMNAPEYIGMPMYHQFESRMFLGLPFFMAKYRYNLINDEIYEESKVFAQAHYIDSLTDIIDNQMLTTSRDIYTNAIVMYTLGKDGVRATPTLYSDKTISFSQQSTKIYDSSVTQDLILLDSLWHFIGVRTGEDQAKRVGTSQLIWNWEKAYQGDIILLGDSGIYPNDYMFINDRVNDLNGICTARTVLHSLNARTGFTTTVTPGMISLSTKQDSQSKVQLTNIVTLGTYFSKCMLVKKLTKDNAETLSELYNEYKLMTGIFTAYKFLSAGYKIWSLKVFTKKGIIPAAKNTISAVKGIYKVLKNVDDYKDVIESVKLVKRAFTLTIKTAKTLKKVKNMANVVKVFKAGKKIFTFGSKTVSAVLAGAGVTVGSIPGLIIGAAIGLLVDIMIDKVIEFFENNNVVVLVPLMHKNNPYAPILSGDNLLLTGSSNVSEETNNNVENDITIFGSNVILNRESGTATTKYFYDTNGNRITEEEFNKTHKDTLNNFYDNNGNKLKPSEIEPGKVYNDGNGNSIILQ